MAVGRGRKRKGGGGEGWGMKRKVGRRGSKAVGDSWGKISGNQ